jgi:hypothetical protein
MGPAGPLHAGHPRLPISAYLTQSAVLFTPATALPLLVGKEVWRWPGWC